MNYAEFKKLDTVELDQELDDKLNEQYVEFKKIIDSVEIVDHQLYEKLEKKVGKKTLSKLFEKYIDEEIRNDIDKMNKVSYYIDNIAKDRIEDFSYAFGYNLDDSVKLYLNQMSEYDLLTPEEEVKMGKKLKELENKLEEKGIEKFRSKYNNNNIDDEINNLELKIKETNNEQQKYDLAVELNELKLYKTYLTTTNQFLNANLRLVVNIAKRYVGQGLEFLDLIQEGNLGLQKALERYDVDKGYKFSTYATWWIRQAIARSIADKGRTIRVPVHYYELIKTVSKVEQQLEAILFRSPTDDEIIKELKDMGKLLNINKEKLREIRKYSQTPVSLYAPVGEEEDSTLVDFIEDEGETIEETVIKNTFEDYINLILPCLYGREKIVTILRHGLQIDKYVTFEEFVNVLSPRGSIVDIPTCAKIYEKLSTQPGCMTLEQVGNIFHVTRERIRQIEAKSLRKLRHKTSVNPFIARNM